MWAVQAPYVQKEDRGCATYRENQKFQIQVSQLFNFIYLQPHWSKKQWTWQILEKTSGKFPDKNWAKQG